MLLHHFCQPSFYNGSCLGEPFRGFIVSVSRASSSQFFEPALRPPSSRFSRRSRADPAAHFSSISCGKCSSPCCGNFRKISAEILREILRNFQHEVFENFRKFIFKKFPLKSLGFSRENCLKFSPRASRAVLTFPL